MDRYESNLVLMPWHVGPWSRRWVIASWTLTAALFVGGAAATPKLRDSVERSWCSGTEGTTRQQCLADQKAIRSGPFGLFHSPPGAD